MHAGPAGYEDFQGARHKETHLVHAATQNGKIHHISEPICTKKCFLSLRIQNLRDVGLKFRDEPMILTSILHYLILFSRGMGTCEAMTSSEPDIEREIQELAMCVCVTAGAQKRYL